jgi:uncharacterized protein YcgL (UPF0745 family)
MKNSLKKEKLQHKLFNSLLQSDFCLFQKKSAKQTSCINSIVKLNSSKWINSLDLLQISKSLKQLVRLFQFLKSQKKSQLLLWVDNKQHQHLLNELLQTKGQQDCAFQIELDLFRNKEFTSVSQVLIALNQTLSANKKTLKYLFEQNILLLTKINSSLENNNLNTYKIFNDLSDFKKLVFIVAVIEQILNKK